MLIVRLEIKSILKVRRLVHMFVKMESGSGNKNKQGKEQIFIILESVVLAPFITLLWFFNRYR